MKSHGYIYILTNPSFPDYIKIGYATDIEERLEQLNRSDINACSNQKENAVGPWNMQKA